MSRILKRLHRVPDLALSEQHPKRTFIRRALEFEIRLSYHDRVLKTLPEPMPFIFDRTRTGRLECCGGATWTLVGRKVADYNLHKRWRFVLD